MHASDSLCAPDQIAFHDQLNAEQSTIQRQAHLSERTGLRFTECLRAGAETEALITSRSLTESPAFNLAIVARHFGLAFFGPIEPK
jgi:hypothetical protein